MKDLDPKRLLQSALLSLLLVLTLEYLDSRLDRPPLAALQTHIQDLAFQSREFSGSYSVVKPEEVVIILMDDESIASLGRTSLWSRAYDVQLIEFLSKARPKVIGLDLVYSEPDTFGAIYHDLLQTRGIPDASMVLQAMQVDTLLEAAIETAGCVYLGISSNDVSGPRVQLQNASSSLKLFDVQGSGGNFQHMPHPHPPIAGFAAAARGLGSVTIPQEADNIVRHYATVLDLQADSLAGPFLSTFAFQMAVDELQIQSHEVKINNGELSLDESLKIPIRRDGAFRINWLGHRENLRHISFYKVIQGKVPAAFFTDKYVFVGVGGSGQADMKTVPSKIRNEKIPGVEVHANAFLNIVNQNFIYEVVGWSVIALLFMMALILAAFFSRLQPRFSLPVVIIMCLLEIILYFAWFFPTFSTTLPIVQMVLITVITYMFGLESARKRLKQAQDRVVAILGQHVSGAVADKLLATEDDALVDRKFVCILFLDIRDFTSFAESRTAEEIIDYQNQVFGFMIELVNAHGGIVNQIMGDGFMAIFGAPKPLSNVCAAGYYASRDILKRLEERVVAAEIPATRIGIGLHAGNVVAGSVGTANRKQYSITGNPVIIAARLEELNKALSSTLVMSKGVYDLLPTSVRDPLNFQQVEIRGRTEPMVVAYY